VLTFQGLCSIDLLRRAVQIRRKITKIERSKKINEEKEIKTSEWKERQKRE
jgi:hypothetical protein